MLIVIGEAFFAATVVGGEGRKGKQHGLRFQWQSVGSVGSFLCVFS